MSYCSICLTKEELLDEESSMLIVRHVPLLTMLFRDRTNRLCIDCVKRFVRMTFKVGRRSIRFEELQEALYEQGCSTKFEDVLRAAVMMNARLEMKIRMTEWRKARRRMQYRMLKQLRDGDERDRRYEEYERMRERRRERRESESVTIDRIQRVMQSASEAEEDEKGELIVRVLKRKLVKEEVEYDIRAIAEVKSATIELYEKECPCRVCKEVVCPSDCEMLRLYRMKGEVLRVYGESGNKKEKEVSKND